MVELCGLAGVVMSYVIICLGYMCIKHVVML
jgi:hypothetical protein